MNWRAGLRWILVFVPLLVCSVGQAEARYRDEPAIVRLSGTIAGEEHYGPPNYGEKSASDLRYKTVMLLLDAPITVVATADSEPNLDRFNDVRKLQLVGRQGWRLDNKAGDHVTVRGTLMERQFGEQVTDVLMQVGEVVSSE